MADKKLRSQQALLAGRAIADLRKGGLVSGSSASALASMVKGLAAAVDRDPQNAALWREYRQAWGELRKEAASRVDDPGADPIDKLLEDLRQS